MLLQKLTCLQDSTEPRQERDLQSSEKEQRREFCAQSTRGQEANLNFITRWNNYDGHLEILGFESRKSSVETSRLPWVGWIYLVFAAAISNFSILKIELDGKPTPL